MSEITTNNYSILNSYRSNSVTRPPVRTLYTKEKTMIHLDRLKTRAGFETHKEHPRPFKDVSSLKRDFDTALDATRKIQANRMGLLMRRLKPEQDNSTTLNSCYSTLMFDDHLSSRANTLSMLKARESERYPLNNTVFKTLWEKIFIPKNAKVNTKKTGANNESLRDESFVDNRCNTSKRSISSYFMESQRGIKGRRESVYENTESLLEDLKEKESPAKDDRSLRIKRDLMKALEKCKKKVEKNEEKDRSYIRGAAGSERQRFRIAINRGNSSGAKETKANTSMQNVSEIQYESEARRTFIIRMKNQHTTKMLSNACETCKTCFFVNVPWE